MDNSIILGHSSTANLQLQLSGAQRATHLHVVGSSGSGKSKFLEGLLRQDIAAHRESGCGLLLLDPHGSLYSAVIAWLAETGRRARHSILAQPSKKAGSFSSTSVASGDMSLRKTPISSGRSWSTTCGLQLRNVARSRATSRSDRRFGSKSRKLVRTGAPVRKVLQPRGFTGDHWFCRAET